MMEEAPPPCIAAHVEVDTSEIENQLRELTERAERLLTPEQQASLEEKARRVAEVAVETRVEVNGVLMTRQEWKRYMDQCSHKHFTHPGVELMDGSRMSICNRCKFIQHESIAKMIEGGEL